MGFWDIDAENSFDKMFDFNGDGHLDSFEQALRYDYLDHEFHVNEQTEEDAIFNSDIDIDNLEDMDEDERREVLEDAGYDPDDYNDI